MSSFDKFMEDIERRRRIREERLEAIRQAEEQHGIRDRVRLYAEKWQNNVRHDSSSRGKK